MRRRSTQRFGAAAALGAAVALGAATPAFADEPGAQPGAEARHASTLRIMLENDTLLLVLEASGADVARLDRPPQSEQERRLADLAAMSLLDPLSMFAPNADAGCRTVATASRLAGQDDAPAGKNEAPTGEDAAAATEGTETPADFQAKFHGEYALRCAKPAALTELALPFFERFETAQTLEVTLISAAGERRVVVSRDAPRIDFAEGR